MRNNPQIPSVPPPVVRSLIAVGVLLGLILLIRHTSLAEFLQISQIPRWGEDLKAFGAWTQSVFLLIGTLILIVGVPRRILAGIAGALFGSFRGILWVQTITLLSGLISFGFARWVAGDWVRRKFNRYPHLDKQFRERGFLVVLLIRLFPVGHNQLTNLLCGASPVTVHSFFWGTLLGSLPDAAVCVFLGGSLVGHTWFRLACAAGVLIVTMTLFCIGFRSSDVITDMTKKFD